MMDYIVPLENKEMEFIDSNIDSVVTVMLDNK